MRYGIRLLKTVKKVELLLRSILGRYSAMGFMESKLRKGRSLCSVGAYSHALLAVDLFSFDGLFALFSLSFSLRLLTLTWHKRSSPEGKFR